MNIMYVHGLLGKFDINNPKIKTLCKIGNVFGCQLNHMNNTCQETFSQIADCVENNKIDLIVGTSLGGYYAWYSGTKLNIPFIAINPAINPAVSLQKYKNIPDNIRNSFNCIMKPSPNGLLVLAMDDEIINSHDTLELLGNKMSTCTFDGGNHRFPFMEELLVNDKFKLFISSTI